MSKALAVIDKFTAAINKAETPEDVIQVEAGIEAYEAVLRKSGLRVTEKQRPWNELRVKARVKLGRILAGELRGKRGPKAKIDPNDFTTVTKFKELLKRIGLNIRLAYEAQQIGCLPDDEIDKAFKDHAKWGSLVTFRELVVLAKPYWQKVARRAKHRLIQSTALRAPLAVEGLGGPFNLIYADPPWPFETWSEDGKGRSAEAHYPVMGITAIANYQLGGVSMDEVAATDAVLFLWCTSSNIVDALHVMKCWGLTYKTHLVWDKELFGTGYIFRNQHELLLYGSRGDPPAPIVVPPSILRVKRGKHSAKPVEVRAMLEAMYPEYDARTRIELFARGKAAPDWTAVGLEISEQAAAE